MACMTLEQIKASQPKIDRVKNDATAEKDIIRHMREDDEDPDVELGVFIEDLPPVQIRKKWE